MKTATLLVFMVVAFATVQAHQRFLQREDMAMFLSRAFRISSLDAEKCLNKTGAKEDDFAEYEMDMNEEPTLNCHKAGIRRITCAMVCCAHIQGTMTNGKINVPYVNNLLNESGMPESALSVIVPIFLWCNDKVKDLTDQCDVGCIFLQCMIDNTKNTGL